MKRRSLLRGGLLLAVVLCAACAKAPSKPVEKPVSALQREGVARDLELAGKLSRARIQWEILLVLYPDTPDYQQQLDHLEEKLRVATNEQLREAREAWDRGDPKEAELHWLKVLALDPSQGEARAMLREISRRDMMKIQAAKIAKIKTAREKKAKQDALAKGTAKEAPPKATTPSTADTMGSSPAAEKAKPEPAPTAEELAQRKARAQALYEDGIRKYRSDLPEAIRLLENCLELDPEHRQAKMQLNRAYRMRATLNRIQEY